jgi:hypothetical protein
MTIRRHGHAFCSAAVGILVASLLAGCSGSSFTDRLTTHIETNDGTDVRLADVIDDGDSFLVVCPYDTNIGERLGFEWAEAPDTFRSDDSQTVVVVDDGRVKSSHRIWLGDIHLCAADMRELSALDEPLDFSQNAAGTWVLVD